MAPWSGTTCKRSGFGFAYGKALVVGSVVPAVLLVVVLMSLGGQKEDAVEAAANAGDYYRVEPLSFDLAITATGELEAKNQVEIKSKVHGRPAILSIVAEGSMVKAGETIVRLDPDDTAQKLEAAKLSMEQAKAALVAAQQTLEIEKSKAESDRRAAEVTLSLAELDLKKWEKGDVVQQRNTLKLGLEKAKRRLERARRDHELSKELYNQKFISLNELEDAELEEIDAEDGVETAQLDIEVYEKYEYTREKQDNESGVEQARAELARTIRKNKSTLERLNSDLDSRRYQYTIREERRHELEDQLKSTVITAPQDGLVVYATSVGNSWRRGEPINEGHQVRYGEKMILLPDTRRMVAVIRVHEALIGQIEQGQKASITIDAQPDEVYAGTVLSKAVTPDDGGWWNPNLREYKVSIEMPAGIEGIRPAMRCTGEVFIGRVEDKLAVPVQAVFADGDQRFCYVSSGGQLTRQPVEIGRASETLVEIISGLATGDRVLLRDPKPGEVRENS